MTVSPDTPLIITSDVHIGSPHCRVDACIDFLERLPDGMTLVLNGDTLDQPREPIPRAQQPIVRALNTQARQRQLIVLEGNHDAFALREHVPAVTCAEQLLMPGRLVAMHGHQIDAVMPAHRHFIRVFRRFHALRVLLGAPDVHVAEYAKKWRLAYHVLVRRQRRNGVQYARDHGVTAIVCGHVHAPEEATHGGIRYLNTGAWTEAPTYCVRVLPGSVDFLVCAQLEGPAL